MITYKFDEKFDEFGGILTLEAHDDEGIQEIFTWEHFHPSLEETKQLITAMRDGIYTATYGSEKRPCFEINGALDLEFTEPYYNAMAKYLGYEGRGILPDLELNGFEALRATFIKRRLWLDNGHLCFQCYETAEEWNKRTAGENAERYAIDYLQEEIGDRKHEPEYIPADQWGATLKHNPNYLKRHRPHPALTCEWLWRELVQWWLDNEATPEQRELVEQDRELHQRLFPGLTKLGKKAAGGIDLQHNRGPSYDGLRSSWEGPCVTWDEFKAMGKAAV